MKKTLLKLSQRVLVFTLVFSLLFGNFASIPALAKQNQSTGLSGAYDGTPSKVIGVKVKPKPTQLTYWDDAQEMSVPYFYGGIDGIGADSIYGDARKTGIIVGDPEAYRQPADNGRVYLYNGIYYSYCNSLCSVGNVRYFSFSSPYVVCTSAIHPDSGMTEYTANGKFYASTVTKLQDGTCLIPEYYEMITIGVGEAYGYKDLYGVMDPTGKRIGYYNVNGTYYTTIYQYKMDNGSYFWYTIRNNRIVMNATNGTYVQFNPITTENIYKTEDNKQIQVGYEIECDGKIVFPTSSYERIVTTDGRCLSTKSYATVANELMHEGDSATYRVRAVYYTIEMGLNDKGQEVRTGYQTYKVGPWSNKCVYTHAGYKVQQVTTPIPTLSYYKDPHGSDNLQANWAYDKTVESYQVEYIVSSVPIPVTKENWGDYHTWSGDVIEQLEATYPDLYYDDRSDVVYTNKWTEYIDKLYYVGTKRYIYIRVKAYTGNQEADIFLASWSDIASMCMDNAEMYPPDEEEVQTAPYVPTVTNFRVVKNMDETTELTWDPVDQNVLIYAYHKSQFPVYYMYDDLGVRTTRVEGDWHNFENFMPWDEKREVDKYVKVAQVDGEDGCYDLSKMKLDYDKTYYFVAYTIDSFDYYTPKAQPYAVIDDMVFNVYKSVSPVSNMISYKPKLRTPEVVTLSSKTGIKLSMTGSADATGYEIYVKSGKKWKKVVYTMNNQYVHKNLKKNTTYKYKVRAFSYDANTKKNCDRKGYEEKGNVDLE